MSFIVGVEGDWVRSSLGARPERLAMGVQMVVWEDGLEVSDVVIVVRVEELEADLDALAVVGRFLHV